MQTKVPFLDLKTHHRPLLEEINIVIREVIEEGAFAGGPFVTSFERDFAAYCRADHAIGVGSGTDALWLSLLAFGVGAGDEVITVPNTFMATAEAISYTGATPVFVDIEERTFNMDPEALESAITTRTKAIIPVHLYGQTADMDPILKIARKHDLPVIEDASQAHGAEYKGARAGTLGDCACFSFYPGKNLGAFGEAGAVVTNDTHLQEKIRIFRDHGQIRKYHHKYVGWNCRMDGIQGAVLSVKLRNLEKGNRLRQAHAAFYNNGFESMEEISTPANPRDFRHVYHIYAIRVQEREQVMQSLTERGIGYGIHYPVPVHLQEAYNSLGHQKGSFPVAERCAAETLSLPMFPELSTDQLEAVIEGVKEAVTVSFCTR
ncbi:MAG: DegT/DnrJ/EryC1/StrS family aminotransferase [Verrucomicrobia bacterium]|nr:DegT/DnrJ/EryC1/StrS family aminotransferase [Verrucomicrobiota bacterium]